ncbi:MAG: 16S rRNA (guanine(966)-N(2))-methyltransferase RsmD [Clostridia bacterium]|nr:16S rRNA (guanine(966)-N(2))-methyltransferase RsmD [Clostridia bacterium]
MMRIITGTARGTKLATLEGEATRPTTERVKEAIFSMIQFDVPDSWFLDLFAGSGQMGLEALSRGAEKAHLIDKSPEAAAIIKQNAQKTHLWDRCRVLNMDWAEYLRSARGQYKFDFVFVDPPYGSGLLHDALDKLADSDLLADNAWIIAEDEKEDIFDGDEALAAKYEIVKSSRYSRVHIVVLTRRKEEA